MAEKKNSLESTGNDLVKSLDNVFKQAPHLPENIREVLVKVAPWLALIFGILGVIGGIGLLGVSPIAMLGGVGNSFMVMISGVLTIVSSVLMLMAYPKLTKHQYAGWMLLFWSELVSIVSSLLSVGNGGGIVGALLGIVIGLYLLFEIKSYYK